MLPIPNDQTLPVIRITIVLNAVQVGNELRPRYVIRDNGGDFPTAFEVVERDDLREHARARVDGYATHRMQHYCALGYAVEPWQVPS